MKTQHENKDGNGKKQGMSPKIIEFFFCFFAKETRKGVMGIKLEGGIMLFDLILQVEGIQRTFCSKD